MQASVGSVGVGLPGTGQRPRRPALFKRFNTCQQARCQATDAATQAHTVQQGALARRALLQGVGALLLGSQAQTLASQAAEAPTFVAYSDPVDNFSIQVPDGWVAGSGQVSGGSGFTGATGARRVLAWYVADNPDANVSIVITNVGADFTRMGSFGSVYDFGTGVVNSMDRSFLLKAPMWARPKDEPIVVAKLVDARERSSMYFVDYTVKAGEDQPLRSLQSVVAMSFNGTYNRLYTVTAQCLAKDSSEYEAVLKQIVGSFKPPPGKA